jgi:hypothetical protein
VDSSKLGFGPLPLIPASLLHHPSAIGKFSKDCLHEVADYAFQQDETVFKRDKDSTFARKRRYDEQLPAAIRYALFRALGYLIGSKVNYPASSEALAKNNPIWKVETCLPRLINCFVDLEDRLTPYFNENVNEPLKSLSSLNGS